MYALAEVPRRIGLPLIIVLGSLPVISFADEKKDSFWGEPLPLYFGGKVSVGLAGGGVNHTGLVKDNDDGSITGVATDKTSGGWKIYATVQPWENIGFQAGYTDLGKDSFGANSSGGYSWAAGPVSTNHKAKGWELTVYDRIPISERYTLFVKAGMFFWEAEQTYTDSGGTYPVDKESGSSVTYGLGFEYDIGIKHHFYWFGELQRYSLENDIAANSAWIGVGLRY